MPVGRDLQDFTSIARVSLQAALADDGLPTPPPAERGASREEMFLARLFCGSTLRHAGRHAGLNRSDARRALRTLSQASLAHQVRCFAGLPVRHLRHCAAWAFSPKQRSDTPTRLDRFGPDAVWTHLCVDDTTALIPLWLVGPNPHAAVRFVADEVKVRWLGALPLESPAEVLRARPRAHAATPVAAHDHLSELLTLRQWSSEKPAGSAMKIALHAQALALFVLHHNYCRVRPHRDATPAMLHGLARRPWSAAHVAALVQETEMTRGCAARSTRVLGDRADEEGTTDDH